MQKTMEVTLTKILTMKRMFCKEIKKKLMNVMAMKKIDKMKILIGMMMKYNKKIKASTIRMHPLHWCCEANTPRHNHPESNSSPDLFCMW